MSEFTNNTNENKNSKVKSLLLRRIPAYRQAGSSGGKIQNYNLKLKINKIQTLVIVRSEATKQSPSFCRVIASPEVSGRSNLFE